MTSESRPSFDALGLAPPVLAALQRVGYEHPTPIQAESIPPLLAGRDLLGTAQTGTGKTAAFALPLLSRIDLASARTQVLVLTPTRELAIQVAEAFQSYAGGLGGFHVLPIYGGQSMGIQLKQLRRGAQVVVGTPGRVMDHLRRGTLQLDGLRTLVLDEADEMLRMGFIDDVDWILSHTPAARQVALFSATMPPPIRRVADAHLKDPVQIRIESRTSTVEQVEQKYWVVEGVGKLEALTRILEVEDHDGVIVFVRTKTSTVSLADRLEARGHSAAAINGDMTQVQREAVIGRLRSGALDVLVATDVAARGIDVPRISHVVNFDIPSDTEAYVHRIGRTGRAGRAGTAILFVAPRERRLLRSIERATRQPMTTLELPSRAEIGRRRTQRFKDEIAATIAGGGLRPFELIVQEVIAETGADAHQVAAALAALAQQGDGRTAAGSGDETPSAEPAPRVAPPPRGASRATPSPIPPRASPPAVAPRASTTPEAAAPAQPPGAHAARPDAARPNATRPDAAGRPPRTKRGEGPELELFRLAVGHAHKVKVGDIVGAIANEAELDSQYIGRIRMYDDHSTVELPVGMPKELLAHLRKVRVRSVPLAMERVDAEPPSGPGGRGPRGPRSRPPRDD